MCICNRFGVNVLCVDSVYVLSAADRQHEGKCGGPGGRTVCGVSKDSEWCRSGTKTVCGVSKRQQTAAMTAMK